MSHKFILLWTAFMSIALAQYNGPTVLSRGASMMDAQKGLPIGFQYYASVNAIADTGILPVSVDSSGNIAQISDLYGVEATFGINGTRHWRHAQLAVHYDGNYRHYTQQTFFDGSDHTLGVDAQIVLSRRLSLRTRNSGGSVSRTLGSLGGFGGYTTAPDGLVGVPTFDIYDNRTYFVQTSDDLTYQISRRLSVVVGGQAFGVRRQSKALIGVNGYGAHASLAYRMSRRSTVDLAYSYFHFDYPRAFGETDINQITGGVSRAITRVWQIGLQGGVYQLNSIGTTQVALDPATAALFGQAVSYRVFSALKYLPTISANLTGIYKRYTVSVGYQRAPNPGNGVFLASDTDGMQATFTYTGIARLSMSATGGYMRMETVGQTELGRYQAGFGGAGMNYRINRDFHLTARGEWRQTGISTQNGLNRLGSRITLGVSYSPGERPLQLFR